MEKEFILILGGARSGKSAYAERLALESGHEVLYIATATAGDEEMRRRIAAHQAARPAHWRTVEAPMHVAHYFGENVPVDGLILLDCVTLLANNVLFALSESVTEAEFQAALIQEVSEIIATFQASPARTLVLVSNEVGLGVVPEYELGRLYRDALGRANQQLAKEATTVWFMLAGLPLRLK